MPSPRSKRMFPHIHLKPAAKYPTAPSNSSLGTLQQQIEDISDT